MAVPTGSGTETLHAHHFDDVDAIQTLIFGVQHHVYTVLSIIVYCHALDATSDVGVIQMKGYDNHGGASGQTMSIARFNIQVSETYVWNDKFSFNGYEPTGTDILSTAAHQTANAAQAGSADQELQFTMTSADSGGQNYDITLTYLDQDWT